MDQDAQDGILTLAQSLTPRGVAPGPVLERCWAVLRTIRTSNGPYLYLSGRASNEQCPPL